jgi:hypothetical protein
MPGRDVYNREHRFDAGRETSMWSKCVSTAMLWGISGICAAVGQMADVSVFDRAENRILPVYQHDGRTYVVGHPGRGYQLRIRNRTGREVLAVVAVDGVNVVTGETAGWEQSGYVFAPRQSYDIRGWRKSMRRIAAFFFTEHENAYATRTGRPENVGVIGVALFRKKHEPASRIHRPSPRLGQRHDGSHDAPAESASPATAEAGAANARDDSARKEADPLGDTTGAHGFSESHVPHPGAPFPRARTLGTGHGRSEASHATYTGFERASAQPAEVITIHYDTYANLVAMGVIREPRHARPYSYPTPFPGQFVPDPR